MAKKRRAIPEPTDEDYELYEDLAQEALRRMFEFVREERRPRDRPYTNEIINEIWFAILFHLIETWWREPEEMIENIRTVQQHIKNRAH